MEKIITVNDDGGSIEEQVIVITETRVEEVFKGTRGDLQKILAQLYEERDSIASRIAHFEGLDASAVEELNKLPAREPDMK